MFLKSLNISKETTIIREIIFHKGLNLIIDETKSDSLQESGNNVGKTTVLRLIDFCLGGEGKNIYQDVEFREKTNTKIEAFLKNENVIITLHLKEDLENESSNEVFIKRNFLKYGKKIQEINGEQYRDSDFVAKLKQIIFSTNVEKPTFRQIISKNIRDEKSRLNNTLKVLHSTTTFEEYEALFLFWLGIDTDSSSRKQKLQENLKIETKVLSRLKRISSISEISQALNVLKRDIDELNTIKNNFNLNENYEADLVSLNNTKEKLNQISTQIGKISLRRDLILESKIELEQGYAKIDLEQLKEIYMSAGSYIENLQISFEKLVEFHNSMLNRRIDFVTEELPVLEQSLHLLHSENRSLSKMEWELADKLKKAGIIEGLEDIIQKLNYKFEQKGKYEEQLKQWNNTTEKIETIKDELETINNGLSSLDSVLDQRIALFNEYFSKLSEELYGEQFILSYEKNDRAYLLKIGSIGGNLGTGKKKGQIAAFDFAYIQYCDENDIPCLHFILHDQIENIHDNQLNILAHVANESNSQFVASVLQDKLPDEINVDDFKVLTLSQDDKLFRLS